MSVKETMLVIAVIKSDRNSMRPGVGREADRRNGEDDEADRRCLSED